MPGFFITATGTDIGKTFVTAGLIRVLRARGQKVSALKPVMSGFDDAHPEGSDTAYLLEALGQPVMPVSIGAISPWRFKAPLSPDMAARKEGRCLDFNKVAAYCRDMVAASDGLTLIEGVGGIMVPLDEGRTVLDLMQQLALPIILVTGTYLGAISHLLSALDVLKTRGFLVSAIVVNESEASSVTMEDTLETLSHFCTIATLIPLARHKSGDSSEAAFSALIEALHIS